MSTENENNKQNTENSDATNDKESTTEQKTTLEEITDQIQKPLEQLSNLFQSAPKEENTDSSPNTTSEESVDSTEPVKTVIERIKDPVSEMERFIEPRKSPLFLIPFGFFLNIFFFSSPWLQLILNAYLLYALFKVHQATADLGEEEQGLRLNFQKASIGLSVSTVLVFFVGGPENIFVPSQFTGTWYSSKTCQEFNVGMRSGSSGNIWHHRSNEKYDALIDIKSSAYHKNWSKKHAFRTDSVRKEINEIQKSVKERDMQRLQYLSDTNGKEWKEVTLNIPLSGGVIKNDNIIEYSSFSLNGTEGKASLINKGKTLDFHFMYGPRKQIFQFVSTKPETCIENPIEHAKKQIPLLESEITESISKIDELIEKDKKERNKSGSGAVVSDYPHPCDNLDPDLHNAVKGDPSQCITKDAGLLINGLSLGKEANVPSGFTDDNPFSYFISPLNCSKKGWATSYDFSCKESSTYSAKERASKKSEAKKTLFRSNIDASRCKKEYDDAKFTIKFSCELSDNLYASGKAYYKEIRKCEPGTKSSCGRCSSSSDCKLAIFSGRGCSDGCSTSRCVGGYCTSCHFAGLCTFDYEMRGVKPFTFSKTFDQASYPGAKKAAEDDMTLLFKPLSGYRKTYTHRYYSDEEKQIKGQSYLWIKVSPKVIYGNGFSFYTSKSFSFKLKDLDVRCAKGECTAKK